MLDCFIFTPGKEINSLQLRRKIILINRFIKCRIILVTSTITQSFHQLGWSISDVQWNSWLWTFPLSDKLLSFTVCIVYFNRLWSSGQVYCCLCKDYLISTKEIHENVFIKVLTEPTLLASEVRCVSVLWLRMGTEGWC